MTCQTFFGVRYRTKLNQVHLQHDSHIGNVSRSGMECQVGKIFGACSEFITRVGLSASRRNLTNNRLSGYTNV